MATRRVAIHFKNNDQSIEGWVVRETRNNWWLVKAAYLIEKAEIQAEGTILVPKRDIFSIQVLEEAHAL
ncbi:MAG: hypothetical protein ACRDQZ_12005 [Mycobacteriales bacterium]